jgi:hypothetical protein
MLHEAFKDARDTQRGDRFLRSLIELAQEKPHERSLEIGIVGDIMQMVTAVGGEGWGKIDHDLLARSVKVVAGIFNLGQLRLQAVTI